MFSVYTSLYNLNNGFIDWKGALDNFLSFADQVCVATLPDNPEDFNLLSKYSGKVSVTIADTELSDPLFDGKLKNAALKMCREEFCILLDGDERVRLNDRPQWEMTSKHLSYMDDVDAFFIPVIDLFNSEREYKSIGQKWYLHKNLPELHRGVVNFARKNNNTIDTNKSDTTELIYKDGSLCRTISLVNELNIRAIKDLGVKVFHLGWLDKNKRLLANKFWSPVWNSRAGITIDNVILDKEELNKIEYFSHGLKLWYE